MTKQKTILYLLWCIIFLGGCGEFRRETIDSKIRIGVYDSRAVAVAYAPSEWNEKRLKEKMAEMEKAKSAGEAKKIAELEAWGNDQQAKLHRQGFSTAPVDDILENIHTHALIVDKSMH